MQAISRLVIRLHLVLTKVSDLPTYLTCNVLSTDISKVAVPAVAAFPTCMLIGAVRT